MLYYLVFFFLLYVLINLSILVRNVLKQMMKTRVFLAMITIFYILLQIFWELELDIVKKLRFVIQDLVIYFYL